MTKTGNGTALARAAALGTRLRALGDKEERRRARSGAWTVSGHAVSPVRYENLLMPNG